MFAPSHPKLGRLLAFLVVAVTPLFGGCHRGDCTKGCARLVDNARREIDAQKLEPVVKKSLVEQADHNRQADVEACVARCNAGDYNAGCLEEAQSVAGAKDCKK